MTYFCPCIVNRLVNRSTIYCGDFLAKIKNSSIQNSVTPKPCILDDFGRRRTQIYRNKSRTNAAESAIRQGSGAGSNYYCYPNHIVFHDLETGEMIGTHRGQGYAIGSTWSRGAAWAVYGFIIAYAHTGEQRYLDTAKKVANDFIANLAVENWLPLVDFRAPAEPIQYDSTAGAIAA